MNELKMALKKRYKMKDMGELSYILGISVVQDKEKNCVLLHQKHYIEAILQKYGMDNANPVATPADANVKLKKSDGVSKPVNQSTYQSIVGSLLYAAMATRPDIAQAVSAVSKFNANPDAAHLTAVKRILRYLKGTVNLALKYEWSEFGTLIGFSDADWAGDQDDRRSTTGNIFLLSGGAVSWLSKKQATVALSTAEAEYVALSQAAQEGTWLRRLLNDLGMDATPTVILEDNQGAIAIAKNPLFSDITALYKLNVSHSPPDSPALAAQSGTSSHCAPWGIDIGDPRNYLEPFGISPFNVSSGPEDIMGHDLDEDLLDMTDEAMDFTGFSGFTGQRPHYTRATYLAPPTPAGSKWNGKASPFGHTTRPTLGSSCEYRGVASAHPEVEVFLWSRPGQKRNAHAVEQGEWKADLPQLKKGKLTYEKVPGRSDGQTRLKFF
ncbi:hypothetical protein SKAU_G00019240 [Synaphobranchus kaupii]|uniref:Reverse transcriptase Ty1/copia-type domain-containing protein n=1 Tax=Synaphobranchus kaupii TaxID=118154 RepID=A0A9Q1JC14_SYNKA|nr:hypothetical protein SKAU_G00019240 [Synaphobranchus kaupii]